MLKRLVYRFGWITFVVSVAALCGLILTLTATGNF
jgi:hypothetical protein